MNTEPVEIRFAVALLSLHPHRPDVTSAVDEMERQGQPVTLVCFETSRHEHETLADVVHVPLLSAGVVSSAIASCIRNPRRLFSSVARAVTASTLLRIPAAIHLARLLSQRGIADVRGIDPVAAKLASAVSHLSDLTSPDLSELPVDWSRIGTRRVAVRWFTRHVNSIVAEVTVDDREERLIVKRQRSHAGGSAADRWALECGVLRSLGDSMRGAFGVPRVLLDDQDGGLVVMERARGTDLHTLFLAAVSDRARMSQLAAAIRGAGAWLAEMQAYTRREVDGHRLLGEVVAIAVEDAAKVAAANGVIRRHHEMIVRYLEERRRLLTARPLTVAGHHDDYWPANIFFDGERVTVIDFESFRDGLALEDPAFFLIRCHMVVRRFRLHFPDLARRFFEGYCPGQQPDRDALQLFTVTTGLRFLARGAGEGLPMPQRIWTRRTVGNMIMRAVRG